MRNRERIPTRNIYCDVYCVDVGIYRCTYPNTPRNSTKASEKLQTLFPWNAGLMPCACGVLRILILDRRNCYVPATPRSTQDPTPPLNAAHSSAHLISSPRSPQQTPTTSQPTVLTEYQYGTNTANIVLISTNKILILFPHHACYCLHHYTNHYTTFDSSIYTFSP